jgi:hydroxyethylthiazole kinase-like sugar kinase family protein
VSSAGRFVCKVLIRVGNSLTVIGCTGLVLGLSDIIPAQLFAIGISSGIRVIGSVAIAGCLLSAMGYGAIEYLEQ